MTVQSMHYDFKQKLNRIDSQQYRDLEVPEIDWKLNEAQEVFVKMVAQPKYRSQLGFEKNQRTIEDIRVLVVNQRAGERVTLNSYDSLDSSFLGILPDKYWFLVSGKAYVSKGVCNNIPLEIKEIQHDDRAEKSVFDKSSFIWRVCNIRYNEEGIRVFTGDGDFIPTGLVLNYIRQPRLIYNAEDWSSSGYDLDGVTLTGRQDCELPSTVHREIVDLAVLIAAGDLSLPDYTLKRLKLELTNK